MAKHKKIKLPKPECKYGYTENQLIEILSPINKYVEFNKWMYGQTGSICDGREYDYGKKEYVATGCGPHGGVVYSSDLERFLQGRPIID